MEKKENKDKKEAFFQKAGDLFGSARLPFSRDFYGRHVGKVFLIMFMLYGYVQLRYAHEEAYYNLGKLKDELQDARFVTISTWGELTSKNKPEKMRNDLQSKANLSTADEPPYLLK